MIDHEARLAEIARLRAEKERLDKEWREAYEAASCICKRSEQAHIAYVDARNAYLRDCEL